MGIFSIVGGVDLLFLVVVAVLALVVRRRAKQYRS